MSASEKNAEALLDRIVLEVKALVLLHGSDAEFRAKVRRKLIDSQDESMKRFTDALQDRQRASYAHLFFIAFGELLLASLLVFAGMVSLVPIVAGVGTPAGLLQFFAQGAIGTIASSPAAQYASFAEFVVGTLLILSALYTLNQAALNLREAGFSAGPGEA